jgi:hypothetical protein
MAKLSKEQARRKKRVKALKMVLFVIWHDVVPLALACGLLCLVAYCALGV